MARENRANEDTRRTGTRRTDDQRTREAGRRGESEQRRTQRRDYVSEHDLNTGRGYGTRGMSGVGADRGGYEGPARYQRFEHRDSWDERGYADTPRDINEDFRRYGAGEGDTWDEDSYAARGRDAADRYRYRSSRGDTRSGAYSLPGYGRSSAGRLRPGGDEQTYVPRAYAGGAGLAHGGAAMSNSFVGGASFLEGRDRGDYRATGDRNSFRGRGPRGYQRSDERLREDIHERLTDDPDVDASDITVECQSGEVTLRGRVDQRWMKHHVEDLVDRCYGVKEIHNQIRVGPSDGEGTGSAAREE